MVYTAFTAFFSLDEGCSGVLKVADEQLVERVRLVSIVNVV